MTATIPFSPEITPSTDLFSAGFRQAKFFAGDLQPLTIPPLRISLSQTENQILRLISTSRALNIPIALILNQSLVKTEYLLCEWLRLHVLTKTPLTAKPKRIILWDLEKDVNAANFLRSTAFNLTGINHRLNSFEYASYIAGAIAAQPIIFIVNALHHQLNQTGDIRNMGLKLLLHFAASTVHKSFILINSHMPLSRSFRSLHPHAINQINFEGLHRVRHKGATLSIPEPLMLPTFTKPLKPEYN